LPRQLRCSAIAAAVAAAAAAAAAACARLEQSGAGVSQSLASPYLAAVAASVCRHSSIIR